MNLLDRILSVQNFNEAIKEVAKNKGAPGILALRNNMSMLQTLRR